MPPCRRNPEHNAGAERNSNVDTIFNRLKYSQDDSREEDDLFQRRDKLEFGYRVGRGDYIAKGMDDDSGETRVGDVEEHRVQEVNSQQDDDTINYPSKGWVHASF